MLIATRTQELDSGERVVDVDVSNEQLRLRCAVGMRGREETHAIEQAMQRRVRERREARRMGLVEGREIERKERKGGQRATRSELKSCRK